MPSNYQCWDAFVSLSDFFRDEEVRTYSFKVFDPHIERVLIDSIKKQLGSGELSIVDASEVTVDWIDNNFLTLSLFATEKITLVLRSENLGKKVSEYILKNLSNEISSDLIFIFGKESKLHGSMEKKIGSRAMTISAPKFWEFDRLVSFFARVQGIQLGPGVQKLLLSLIPHDCDSIVSSLNLLKLHSEGKVIDRDLVSDLIRKSKLEQFELAELLNQKNMKEFYRTVLNAHVDLGDLDGIFGFLQSHLFKLHSPSILKEKPKLSKYDREILSSEKRWSKTELRTVMREFSTLQLLAKKKDDQLMINLKKKYLELV
jgi:DNA polymerase III delta subunit